LGAIEKFYIYKETKNGNQINDKNTVKQNRIYDAVIQGENGRLHSHNSLVFKQSYKLVIGGANTRKTRLQKYKATTIYPGQMVVP